MSNSKETVEILKNVPLFNGLNNRQLKSLAGGTISRRFSKGEEMVHQGEGGVGIFTVVSGRRFRQVGCRMSGAHPLGFFSLMKKDAEMAVSVAQEMARRFRITLDSMF